MLSLADFIDKGDIKYKNELINSISDNTKNNFKLFAICLFDHNKDKKIIQEIEQNHNLLEEKTGDKLAVITIPEDFKMDIDKNNHPSLLFFNFIEKDNELKVDYYELFVLRKFLNVKFDDLVKLFEDISECLKIDDTNKKIFQQEDYRQNFKNEIENILKNHQKIDVKITEISFKDVLGIIGNALVSIDTSLNIGENL